jgi:hypothetical protein
MTGPQDPAAAGGGRLRADRADREQVIETLKDAYVQGRLTIDELDARAGRALASQTQADLAALTADLPASPAALTADLPASPAALTADLPASPAAAPPALPPARARRRQPLARAAAGSGACLVFALGAVLFAAHVLDPDGLGNPYHPWSMLCALAAFAAGCAALCIAVNGASTSLEQRRSRRQLPPGPGGHGLDGEENGGAGRGQVPHGGAGRGPVPHGPSDGQASRAELRAHESRQRRRHVPARVGRASRGARPTPGAA